MSPAWRLDREMRRRLIVQELGQWPAFCDPKFHPKFLREGGYFQKNWVGVCCTLQETLNLFQTKICDFPYPISNLIKNLMPYFRPEALEPSAWLTDYQPPPTPQTPHPPCDILNTCLTWIFLFSNAVFSLELNNLTLPSPQDVSNFNKKKWYF